MISSAKRTLTCPPHSQVKHHAVKRHVGSGMASHSLSVSESSQATIFCSSPCCWVFAGNSAYDLHVSNFKHEILPHSQLSEPKAPTVQGCNGNGGCYQRSSCALTFVPPYIYIYIPRMESTFIRSPIFGLERRLLNRQWNLHFKVRIRNAWNPLNLLTFKALKLRTILRHVRFWLEPQFLGRIQIVLETFKSNTPETSLSLLLWREWLRFPYLCSWIDTGRTDTDRIDPARTSHAAPGPDRTGQTLLIW